MSKTTGFQAELVRAETASAAQSLLRQGEQNSDVHFTHDDIVEMELALELCNSFVAITNKQQDALEQAVAKDEARIGALRKLRLQFLHDWQSQITRENLPWVRNLIATYGPELKNYHTKGVLPRIIAEV